MRSQSGATVLRSCASCPFVACSLQTPRPACSALISRSLSALFPIEGMMLHWPEYGPGAALQEEGETLLVPVLPTFLCSCSPLPQTGKLSKLPCPPGDGATPPPMRIKPQPWEGSSLPSELLRGLRGPRAPSRVLLSPPQLRHCCYQYFLILKFLNSNKKLN